MSALEIHQALLNEIKTLCANQGGKIDFALFMQTILYHPTLGYYCNPKNKIGPKGDFITAPSLSVEFCRTLCRQIQEIQNTLAKPICVLELGAGQGQMASEILNALADESTLEAYYILEISPHMIALQKEAIKNKHPDLLNKVHWIGDLSEIPQPFDGVVIGNEFLDALPVSLFKIGPSQTKLQGFVKTKADQLELVFEPSTHDAFIQALESELSLLDHELPEGYLSEINLNSCDWIEKLSQFINQGILLFIDYGFTRQEYFLTERNQGTIMCHHKHKSHSDFFYNLGTQDVTAHVNFSEIAEKSLVCDLEVLGFTNQAAFLLALDILKFSETDDPMQQKMNAQQLQILLQPHEMGELFKIIALGKNYPSSLSGFSLKDYRYKL